MPEFLRKNQTAIVYAILLASAGVYFWPIRQQASIHNTCVSEFMFALKGWERYQGNSPNESERWNRAFYGNALRADAIGYCNTGMTEQQREQR